MLVAADIMGPFPRSKLDFAYVLIIQDLFTKWIECHVLRAANGRLICEALEDLVVLRSSTPRSLLTDNDMEFINKMLQSFAKECGIILTTVPPYHTTVNNSQSRS